jgi:hypothetical protein
MIGVDFIEGIYKNKEYNDGSEERLLIVGRREERKWYKKRNKPFLDITMCI